jgi:hypothetical protein
MRAFAKIQPVSTGCAVELAHLPPAPRRPFREGCMAGGRIHPARQPKRGADRSALRAPAPLPKHIAACIDPIAGDGIRELERRAVVAVARLAIHPHPRGLRRDLAECRNWAWS